MYSQWLHAYTYIVYCNAQVNVKLQFFLGNCIK